MTTREIDAQIVEHITGGWFTTGVKEYRWLVCAEFAKQMRLIPADMHLPAGHAGSSDEIPRYSSDPLASDRLIEKMLADGWCFELVIVISTIRTRFWRLPVHARSPSFAKNAETRHMAIAAAALAAVEHPVEVTQ